MIYGLVGCATQTIVYDYESYILYRQHENNVVGVKEETLENKIKRLIKKSHNKNLRNSRSKRAKEVYEKYSEFISNDLIKACAYPQNIKNRIILLNNYSFFKEHNSWIEYAMFVLVGFFNQ